MANSTVLEDLHKDIIGRYPKTTMTELDTAYAIFQESEHYRSQTVGLKKKVKELEARLEDGKMKDEVIEALKQTVARLELEIKVFSAHGKRGL